MTFYNNPIVLITIINNILCQEFSVLKISKVPFPSYAQYVARTSAPYHTNISEFTVCYRLQIESYNEGLFTVVTATEDPPIDNIKNHDFHEKHDLTRFMISITPI